MKAFIALCFLAVAFAEPEAEADPYLLYSGYAGYRPITYGSYAYAPSVYSTAYTNPIWNHYNAFGYRYLAKRDAEADADPYLLYKSYNPYVPYTSYSAYHHVAAPVTYTTNPVVSYAKPVVYSAPVAKPVVYTAPVATPVATHITQKNGAVESTAAIHSNPTFVGGYANQGQYYANSAGTVHVAKREAEAEAEADPYLFYRTAGYHYSPYVSRAYSAYTPYTTAYRHFGYSAYPFYHY